MKFTKESLQIIAQTLYDKKGFNTLVLDVKEISSISDFMVIAEGSVDRHVSALSQAVQSALKENGMRPVHVEGEAQGDWVVIDYLDCIVHIFTPQMREKYRLEELWRDSAIVDIPLLTESMR